MQKNSIQVKDKAIIKVLKKPFTKKILDCFNDKPKTAAQIANSISFPKDKIYYHIKNLLKHDILIVESKKIVKGIEQKLFFPSTKNFLIIDDKKINNQKEQVIKPKNKKNLKANRKTIERRNINDRRFEGRRSANERRLDVTKNYDGLEKRIIGNRRKLKDKRINKIRREISDRRIIKKRNKDERKRKSFQKLNIKSKTIQNMFLYLNGIKKAMTFVHSGNNVTFLLCKLSSSGFEIKRINNYKLPFKINEYKINTLTELIINVSNQVNTKKDKSKIFLAIHSDSYNCEMTYISAKGKNKNLFKKDLINTLTDSHSLKKENSIFDFVSYSGKIKNATVCISNKGPQINKDYTELIKSGLQPRYNTSIPQILNNIITYYDLNQNEKNSLLIYIDREKTHIVFSKENRLYDSKEINKGLHYFQDALLELSLGDIDQEKINNNTLHFLSYYGFGPETSDTSIYDGIPFKKARSILDHLILGYMDEIKNTIQYFEDVLINDGFSDKFINRIFISGVGSHIKNIDKILSANLNIEVKNLSDFNTAYLSTQKQEKGYLINKIKTNSIFKKKINAETEIQSIKKRIQEHEKAIESSTSPESAKYRLTRLEIEKSAKIKSIESANQKLVKASKEFKTIKSEYVNDQENLKSEQRSISSLIEEESDLLIEKYKKHEQFGFQISELEYMSDNSKEKNRNSKKERKGVYENRVKHAARSRAKLADDRERFEQEIDNFESTILKLEKSLHQLNQKIDNGKDEVSVFEYLKQVIQETAGAFKRSFLEHLKSIEKLTSDDLNSLEKSSYLLIQNTNRIEEIKESFSSMVSGDNDSNKLIDNSGLDIKQKLLNILSLVIGAPDNIIHLKNLTRSIIKINESQKEMINNKDSIQNKKINAKRSIRDNQKKLTALKKEIKVYENDLNQKVRARQEKIDLLQYIIQVIELIHDFEHHTVLLKELKPQRRTTNKELSDISNKILKLNSLISSCDNNHEKMELENAELKHSYNQEQKLLNDKLTSIGDKEKMTKEEIDVLLVKKDSQNERLTNARIYIEQLEKQILSKKSEIENLNEEKLPLVKKLITEEKELERKFEKKKDILADEEKQKLIESEKIKSTTIDIYFKKQVRDLETKYKSYERLLNKTKKDKIKAENHRKKTRSYLREIKNKNMPNISKLYKQIQGWEKNLRNGRRLQERLEKLESKKTNWDELLDNEKINKNNQIDILRDSIERKKSESYVLFLKDGLNRFKNDGDIDEIANSMVEESITLDLNEIKKLESSFNRFYKTYEAFLIRYRKNKKDILNKLKPYGGSKKIILGKITKAKERINRKEAIINRWIDKENQSNSLLIKKQKELAEINKSTIENLAEIEFEIKEIPKKKDRAKLEIDKKLNERLDQLNDKRMVLNNEKDEEIKSLKNIFNNEPLIIKVNEAEEKMLFFFSEIEKTKQKIESLEKETKRLSKSNLLLESTLKKLFDKHDTIQNNISKKEEKFQNQNTIIQDKINSNRKELAILKEQLLVLDQQKDSIMTRLNKIEGDYNLSNDIIVDLKKRIVVPNQILNSNIEYKKKKKNEKSPSKKELLHYLTQIEKDLKIDIKRSEDMIQEFNIIIDTMQNEESGLQSSISLLENDLGYFDNDLSRIITLIDNNKEHLLKISSDHRKSLNRISNIKDLYPSCKIMLNDRITNLYTLLELKTRDKEEIDVRINQNKEDLKNKRVEAAMLEQELFKINKDMKNALENSFYEKEESDDEWKWEIADNKINSYADLAKLKNQSKGLFNSIVKTEQQIAKLKNQQASVKNMIYEKEKISHKKIKRMEEICTRLELQITKEKNELNGLEQEVRQLTGFAFNYGDRIQVLKNELKQFREKQTEYEFEIKELDRSLNFIEKKSESILERQKSIKNNSIHLDYMANLGLIMNPQSDLNLLPEFHKKEFKYFRPNQILQNAVLVLITVFSIGSFVQRTKIHPLEKMLPIKTSELSLLKMRQEMKDIVYKKNIVANSFQKLIESDKTISKEMISILKYLSQNIPNSFKVTTLNLKKNKYQNITERGEDIGVLLTINGFYDKNIKDSSLLVKKLQKLLIDGKKFKSVDVSDGKKLTNKRTSYSFTVVR